MQPILSKWTRVAALLCVGTVALTCTVAAAPAFAFAAAPVSDQLDPAFAAHVAFAAAKQFPSARVAQRSETTTSAVDEAHALHLSDVGLDVNGNTVVVERQVGAQPPLSTASLGNAADTRTRVLHRGPDVPTAYLRKSATTTIAWTERPGVGYSISARTNVTPAQLIAIAEALPADASTVTPQTLSVIKTLTPATAGATPDSTSSLVVNGTGVTGDDLNDEATLSNNGSYWNSNYTALWQGMLFSESLMTRSDVDCQFGPHTATETSAYQARYSAVSEAVFGQPLPQTGKFDAATRRLAAYYIVQVSAPGDGSTYVEYIGINGGFIQIHRQTSALSYRYDVNLWAEWHGAWYTSASYTFC